MIAKKIKKLKNRDGIVRLHYVYLKTRLKQEDFEYVIEEIVDKLNEVIDYIEDLKIKKK